MKTNPKNLSAVIKAYLLFLMLIPTVISNAQSEQENIANTQIDKVTVYLNGANISRAGTVNLQAGMNNVIIPYVSKKVIPGKIQAQIGNNARIIGMDFKSDHLKKEIKKDMLQQAKWTDTLKFLSKEIKRIAYLEATYQGEKNMIEKNASIQVTNITASYVAEFQRLSAFYSTRVLEINKQLFVLDEEKKTANEKMDKLTAKISQSNSENLGEPVPQIRLTVFSDVAGPAALNLNYLAGGAAWSPKYLINVEETGTQLTMDYNAGVMNQTGENWNNVNLVLSTADPDRPNSLPSLNPMVVNKYSRNMDEGNLTQYGSKKIQPALVKNQTGIDPLQGVEYEQIAVPDIDIEFKISEKYTIYSNSTAYLVKVSKNKLNAKYDYYSIPKLEKEAFLVAQITGWEKLSLIEGPTTIYYQGRYIGESKISPEYANDTLDISLGRTQKVLITRIKTEDKNSKKIIANDVIETVTYRTTFKNTSATVANIIVEDQVPVSQDEEVKVEVKEISNAEIESASGMLIWKLALKPGESKELIITYSVQYPKSKRGINLFNDNVSKRRYKCRAAF